MAAHVLSDFAPDARWSATLPGGVRLEGTEDPASPVLDAFFAGYDRAFVLADEREEMEGFRRCLALNPASRRRFGRAHRELVIVAREGEALLGGANFLATALPAPPGHPPVAVALNYLYVEEARRGRGLSRLLLSAVARMANRAVDAREDGWPAVFIEQNDPLLLSAEQYAADSAHAGIDQVERLAVWARLGAALVDLPYVQPALSADQRSDGGLAYAAVGFPLSVIDAGYLRDHLESFFGISVLKGGNPMADPDAGPQLAALAAQAARDEAVPLLPLSPVVERLRREPGPRGLPLRRFARLDA